MATPKRTRVAPERFGSFASERSIRGALRPRVETPKSEWAVALEIVSQKQNEAGETEYLVKFLGEDELQWASEVSEDLLKRWKQRQLSTQSAELVAMAQGTAAAAEPAAQQAEEATMEESAGGSAEFFAKALAFGIQDFLRKRRNFSEKNPLCMVPRHSTTIAIPPKVFVDLFREEVGAALFAKKLVDALNPRGFRFQMPVEKFQKLLEKYGKEFLLGLLKFKASQLPFFIQDVWAGTVRPCRAIRARVSWTPPSP
eukprot:m.88263 g.88263  ORF g.88263 m.88263 type:complete len:256 (+) comp13617_c0_seq5:37-804(+)